MTTAIETGRRDQIATIDNATATRSAAGETLDTWTEVATAWVHVRALSGREAEYAAQIAPGAQYLVVMPYMAVVSLKSRIRVAGMELHIDHLDNPNQSRVELRAYCRERI